MTEILQLLPAAIACPAQLLESEKSPLIVTDEICRVDVPVFVMVTVCALLLVLIV